MAGESFQLNVEGWQKKRIEKALERARKNNSVEDWQFLFDLSAAYGLYEITKFAVSSSSELKNIFDKENKADITEKSEYRADSPRNTITARINSPTPFARKAWLKAWANARGFSISETKEENLIIFETPLTLSEIKTLLSEHNEVTLEEYPR